MLERLATNVEMTPGMPAEVFILTGEQSLFSYITRRPRHQFLPQGVEWTMASKKVLNAENLEALGAKRLAELRWPPSTRLPPRWRSGR
jgi:hypothetical protein